MKYPKVWVVECKYCQEMQKTWGITHETEIMDKARKLCKSPHFLDFVQAELIYVDHANLGNLGQISLITQIHDKTGCRCLDTLVSEISDVMKLNSL